MILCQCNGRFDLIIRINFGKLFNLFLKINFNSPVFGIINLNELNCFSDQIANFNNISFDNLLWVCFNLINERLHLYVYRKSENFSIVTIDSLQM